MKTLIFFLGFCISAFAQQGKNNLKVSIANDSLNVILKQYVQHMKKLGYNNEEIVVQLKSAPTNGDNADRSVWYIRAFTNIDGLRNSPPALVAEVEGYNVVVYFNVNTSQLFTYSTEYLNFLDRELYQKFKKRPPGQRTNNYEGWVITLAKGQKTGVKVML